MTKPIYIHFSIPKDENDIVLVRIEKPGATTGNEGVLIQEFTNGMVCIMIAYQGVSFAPTINDEPYA